MSLVTKGSQLPDDSEDNALDTVTDESCEYATPKESSVAVITQDIFDCPSISEVITGLFDSFNDSYGIRKDIRNSSGNESNECILQNLNKEKH
jgi:hypothetical protein